MTTAPPETAAPAEAPAEPRQGPPRPRPRPWRRSAGDQPDGPRGSWLWLTRLGHVALWLLVAGGAGAGIASLALHASPSATPPPAEPPAPTTPAEGFAELYVAAYLQAGQGAEETIEAFYPATVTLADVTPGAMWVARTTALAADEQSPGYWAVTVAADVLTAAEEGWEPAPLRYYTVGIVEVGGALAATGLPSQVAAPPAAVDAPEPAVATLGSTGDEPAVDAVDRFLAAYLAGDGELDRYTAPGADLAPVDPAPFVEVEVGRVGSEPLAAGGTLLRAEVTARDDAGLVQVLEYSLELLERDGRLEVAALHPAPPLPQPTDP